MLLALSVALPSCITPWVVAPIRDPNFTLESSNYPGGTRIVELERDGEPTLRGIFVPHVRTPKPAATGAKLTNEVRFLDFLVVHFAESGGCVATNSSYRHQYLECLEFDLPSLAIDYQGVGLSDGEAAPRELDSDALAIYEHARKLVGGNESRLILRGSSIGGLAIASILESGARPGAVILYAPVLAETVGIRYLQGITWKPLALLAWPFARSFMSARLIDQLAAIDTRMLVFADTRDELLNEDEFARLKAAVHSAGGTFEAPSNLVLKEIASEPRSSQFKYHVALAMTSYELQPLERELFQSWIGDFYQESFQDLSLGQ